MGTKVPETSQVPGENARLPVFVALAEHVRPTRVLANSPAESRPTLQEMLLTGPLYAPFFSEAQVENG